MSTNIKQSHTFIYNKKNIGIFSSLFCNSLYDNDDLIYE